MPARRATETAGVFQCGAPSLNLNPKSSTKIFGKFDIQAPLTLTISIKFARARLKTRPTGPATFIRRRRRRFLFIVFVTRQLCERNLRARIHWAYDDDIAHASLVVTSSPECPRYSNTFPWVGVKTRRAIRRSGRKDSKSSVERQT